MAKFNKIDLQQDEWFDQIFEGRNKAYGAYALRNRYSRNALLGVSIAVASMVIILLVPRAVALIASKTPPIIINDPSVLTPPPKVDVAAPKQVPIKIELPPPAKAQVRFTIPKVVPDDQATAIDPPPAINAIKNSNIGSSNIKSNDNAVEIPEENPNAGIVVGEKTESPYVMVEIMPAYPGGDASLLGDLSKYLNNHYPLPAKENGIQGKVTVNFIVEKDGSVSNIKVLGGQDIGGGLPEVAIEAVKRLKNFSPGIQNGNKVRVYFSVPLTFHLENGE